MGWFLLEQLQWWSFLWFDHNDKHICLRQGLLFKDWGIMLFAWSVCWNDVFIFDIFFLFLIRQDQEEEREGGRERKKRRVGKKEREDERESKQVLKGKRKTKKGRKKKERRQAKQAAGAESEQDSFSLIFFCLLINHCSSFVTGLCYP